MKNETHTQNNPENFIEPLRHLTLSKTEAHDMRERLIAYADMHNVVTPLAQPSVFFTYIRTMQFSRGVSVASLMVVFLVGSVGVSYAAENTLPGEPLYAVKVSIAEPLHTALITSPSEKAEWENELAGRRLAEASTLASQNKLASSTQTYLAQAVAEHVANSEASTASIEASGDAPKALAIKSDLEAQLSAHVDVLALMTPRLVAEGDGTTTSAVLALAENVDASRANVTRSREAIEQNSGVTLVAQQKDLRDKEQSKLFIRGAAHFGLALPAAATATSASTTTTTTVNVHPLPAPDASNTDPVVLPTAIFQASTTERTHDARHIQESKNAEQAPNFLKTLELLDR
jgi:hypothetical protein